MMDKCVKVQYFSDVLCIWAFVAQIRIDELTKNFGEQVNIQHHYVSVFGATQDKMYREWQSAGGYQGYSERVKKIAGAYPHIEVHPNVWNLDPPQSSGGCHLFLKAVDLLQREEEVDPDALNRLTTKFREIFFVQAKNIGLFSVQRELAAELDLPLAKIERRLFSGEAFAALDLDYQLAQQLQVKGSPTLIFNEGRQKIYGNVGYRVLEANMQELLHQKENEASWC